MRSIAPLERFLHHIPTLNRRSLFGLLKLCIESPTLTRGASVRVQMAVTKFIARNSFPQEVLSTLPRAQTPSWSSSQKGV